MKRILILIVLLAVLVAAAGALFFLAPATNFKSDHKYLYISSKAATPQAVMDSLQNGYLRSPRSFNWLADRMDYWKNIKPGKYRVNKGENILSLVRKLRNGQQSPVNLTITKLRLPQDLSRLVGRRFETDSADMMRYLLNKDSLDKYSLTPETALSAVFPDTYTYFWNSDPETIFEKLHEESEKFWTDERKHKATLKGLTPEQAYTMASIIEEETNADSDKPKIASVYLNRIKAGMPLQADPTVKYALKNFALKRILNVHTKTESPWNTYYVKGLPPGPICTPSRKTIEAVLDAPQTEYYYFVANSDLSGTHIFTTNLQDHLKYAREYQKVLNKLEQQRQDRQNSTQ